MPSTASRDRYWTPARIVLAVVVVAAGAAVIGYVGQRELGKLKAGLAADATYAKLLERAATDPAAGFNLDGLTVPRPDIVPGGPPKDGIPALDDPPVVSVADAEHLRADDRVIGVRVGGQARAYPVRALMYHEIVNDRVGGVPIAVVYCPLCDSVTVVDRRLDGRTYRFGVSGLLYHSNVLLFDRTDDALWTQLGFAALSGPHAGRSLRHLPWTLTTLAAWRQEHADATVMTLQTGYERPYDRVPYGDYFETDRLLFPVSSLDPRLAGKARVVGVRRADTVRAYPVDAIRAAPDGLVRDTIGGEAIVLRAAADGGSVRVVEAPADAQVAHAFWFAWAAIHPETEIHGQ